MDLLFFLFVFILGFLILASLYHGATKLFLPKKTDQKTNYIAPINMEGPRVNKTRNFYFFK
jgi:hypothetical protein